MEREAKSYSKEFQVQVLKECLETGNHIIVAKKHKIPASTVYGWLRRYKNKDKTKKDKTVKTLEKELADTKLENRILKELLKKSHQLWLKD